MDKIDFILPWVDPNDKGWQKEKAYYEDRSDIEDDASQTRFRDMQTLKYVLRSIEKYCPWYHKIYLITAGHYPEWLNIDHPKIALVTHNQLFFDQNHLPVFNSNAIEMNLANLNSLAEKFVYLNDDTFIWKETPIERFFRNGKAVDFFYHGWFPRKRVFSILKGEDAWIASLNNNIELINDTFTQPNLKRKHLYHKSYTIAQMLSNFLYKNAYKKLFWLRHWHHPQPYTKQTIKNVFAQFSEKMLDVSAHKFRTKQDLTPYLYRYWHLLSGDFEPFYHNDGYVARIKSLNSLHAMIKKLQELDHHINFVCFNDQALDIEEFEFTAIARLLQQYLETKFPQKASFEL